MPDVVLEEPTPGRLLALARAVSTTPVDPAGITDHRWLHGDPDRVRDRIQRSLDHCTTTGGGGWIIAADGRPAGLITVKLDADQAETFSFVCSEWQGRGVATAARAALLAEFRSDPRVRLVVSTARAGSPSATVSRRLGYACVGTEVRRHPEHGGEVVLERYELELTR
jgi:RimJ/RimL family protein N-acetyltransferase